MICFNLRAGDRLQIGPATIAFISKEAGMSRFELVCAGLSSVLNLAPAGRVSIGGTEAFFTVEKRSGRAARIALHAPADIAVNRLYAAPDPIAIVI